ncbi:MAG: hypothetical protein ACF8OB_18505 [Phycisphaeraceae bacterium JB051]
MVTAPDAGDARCRVSSGLRLCDGRRRSEFWARRVSPYAGGRNPAGDDGCAEQENPAQECVGDHAAYL